MTRTNAGCQTSTRLGFMKPSENSVHLHTLVVKPERGWNRRRSQQVQCLPPQPQLLTAVCEHSIGVRDGSPVPTPPPDGTSRLRAYTCARPEPPRSRDSHERPVDVRSMIQRTSARRNGNPFSISNGPGGASVAKRELGSPPACGCRRRAPSGVAISSWKNCPRLRCRDRLGAGARFRRNQG